MACQQLISHVRASSRYLGNLAAEHLQTAVNGQIAALKTYIAKIAGPDEALQASEAIQTHFGAYLTASHKRDLQGLLNDAACKLPLVIAGKAAAASGASGLQYWQDTFWRDVPKDVFEAIGDKSAAATARMQKVFKYLADMGLRAPSEKTFSAMLSLFFYVDGCPAGITSATLLAAVQQIKDAWKAYIQEYKKCNPDNASCTSWPGPPPGVVCVRLDFIRFMNIYNQIPCRNSHGSVQQQGRAIRGQPLTVFESSSPRRALTLDTAGAIAGGPLAIEFPGHRGIAAGALVGAGEDVVVRPNGGEVMLALPAPAAELALPGPAGDAIQTAVGGEAAPARVSLAAVTAQLRADSARRGAEKKAKAKEKRNKKKKGAGKTKTAGKKRAADTEDATEEKTAGKKKKKTAGKTQKKIAKKRVILKKSKTLGKASETHLVHDSESAVCQECGSPEGLQLADGNLAEICVWCAEAQEAEYQAEAQSAGCKRPLKKPACCKRPAAKEKPKTGPVPPAADREANRTADAADRKVFFMRWGCSKCRWQAGCTKSCWRGRNMEQPEDVN